MEEAGKAETPESPVVVTAERRDYVLGAMAIFCLVAIFGIVIVEATQPGITEQANRAMNIFETIVLMILSGYFALSRQQQ